MIMIDVVVPPLDEIFDFEVDENKKIADFKNDVERLIEKKENVSFGLALRELFLYRVGEFLKETGTLREQGIVSGDRLILI